MIEHSGQNIEFLDETEQKAEEMKKRQREGAVSEKLRQELQKRLKID